MKTIDAQPKTLENPTSEQSGEPFALLNLRLRSGATLKKEWRRRMNDSDPHSWIRLDSRGNEE